MKKMTYSLFVDLSKLQQFHHVDASLAAFAKILTTPAVS